MRIPDNFVLLVFAALVAFGSYFVPETSPASKLIAQLWAILLIMIRPDNPIIPGKSDQGVPS